MSLSSSAQSNHAGRRDRLGWLALVALAVLVVCSGCFMLFAFALAARTELDVSLLGSDWRVWQLQAQGTNGIGISQAHGFTSDAGQSCRYVRVWLFTWRPAFRVEATAYDDCSVSGLRHSAVAQARRSAIITTTGYAS